MDQASETKEIDAAEQAEKIEEQASKLMEGKQIQRADSIGCPLLCRMYGLL